MGRCTQAHDAYGILQRPYALRTNLPTASRIAVLRHDEEDRDLRSPRLATGHQMVLDFEARRHTIILERIGILAVFGVLLVANTAVAVVQGTGTGAEQLPGTGGTGILTPAALLGIVSLIIGALLWWRTPRR